ncbi:MAG TPA: A/G-specific adenine glycosylase [Candidatus Paceibacterota bacterium]|nr:A/G-specific adenine glycosylase [Candidatus Paceibacterota bacterium]
MAIANTKKSAKKFISTVYDHYRIHARSFPWRETNDPYKILVSEIMLQQTQADRVVEKYNSFITQFPTIEMLARAPLSQVLKEWKGLGYNRRAKYLHSTAQIVIEKHNGAFPKDLQSLIELPGIGEATAGDILAFAFNIPEIVIETNIRTVFIHHFFPETHGVSDKELIPLIEKTLDKQDPRSWYYALMDYGSMLKKTIGNVSKRSSTYTKQSAFKGSTRELRAKLLFELSLKPRTLKSLSLLVSYRSSEEILNALMGLLKDGMIEKKSATWYIHGDATDPNRKTV